jgi:hypothetical protein
MWWWRGSRWRRLGAMEARQSLLLAANR